MVRSPSCTAVFARRIVAGLACAVVLIALAALLQGAALNDQGDQSPQAAAGVCADLPDGTPGNDACWRAPQPVNVLTATTGWPCPDVDASCDRFIVRAALTAASTHSLSAPPASHREIHRRSIPLLI